jgi:hypothetical protein
VAHRLELAPRPPNDIGIDPLQRRTQLRLVEVAVVVDPAADARVVHLGQVSQGFVAAVMHSNFLTDQGGGKRRPDKGLFSAQDEESLACRSLDLTPNLVRAQRQR